MSLLRGERRDDGDLFDAIDRDLRAADAVLVRMFPLWSRTVNLSVPLLMVRASAPLPPSM